MERDKKGRFVKKALVGTSLNSGLSTSNTLIQQQYNKPKIKYGIYNDGKTYDEYGNEVNMFLLYNDQKSLYETDENGNFKKDENGNFIRKKPSVFANNKYEFNTNLNPLEITTTTNETNPIGENSYGFNTGGEGGEGGESETNTNQSRIIDKTKLANWLELARAGIGASVNNKIAKKALEVEKPFLQDVSESHRSIYGDYRSQLQGEQAAALLRNMASKPLTSDGVLLQQMMMEAQLKGQEYINQGNAQDENMIRQAREVAWELEKENLQQRQAAAMLNRHAMLMTEKNKAQIENTRDSANYSQVLNPLLTATEQRLRNKGVEQEYYQNLYDEALIDQEVWNDSTNLTPEQLEYQKAYLTGGSQAVEKLIGDDNTKMNTWLELSRLKQNESLRRRAALKGVNLNSSLFDTKTTSDPYAYFRDSSLPFNKKGGTIYRAILTKRTRDNDRAAKSIESSKKIAARFLEKALASLHTYKEVELIAKPKYQSGGSLPFVSFTPVFATSESGTPQLKKKELEGEDLTTKDILELLKDMDGLESDTYVIQQALSNFIIADKMDPLGLNFSSNIASKYMTIISNIKKAKANKEWYDKAYDKLRDNNALNEYAVTNEGYLIGMNEERDFKYFNPATMDLKQFIEEGYLLLTNSNLLDLRNRDINVAFNSQLIMEAANGISTQQISEYINKTIQDLGSNKEQTQVFGNQSKEVLTGLQQLQQAAKEVGQDLSLSLLYEANIMTEHLVNQAHSALIYLWNTLPSNMRSLLLVKGGGEEGAIELMTLLVNSKLSSTKKLEFSPKNTKSSSGKKVNSLTEGLDLSPAQMLQQGFGEREFITIQDSSSTGLQVNAITMPITKKGNEPLGAATLEDVATSLYGGILNFTNASMGGQIIPFEGRRNIAVDGSKIYSMYLPIDQDAFTKGDIIPDISLIDKVNEVNKVIKERLLTTPQEINAVYEEAGLPVYLNDNGTVVPGFYRRFGVLNGTAIDNAFGKTFVESKYLKKTDDENIINNAISIMNQGRSKEDRIEYDSKNFFNFGGLLGEYDTIYQGTIFIPMSNDVFLGIAGSGKTVTSTEANDLEAQLQQLEKITTYRNPGQLQ